MNAPSTHRALILAAGRGSRMGARTDELPKCLSPLAGQPLLTWTLAALRANGFTDIRAVGGWQHDRLAPWFETTYINPQWSTSNMVRSLLCAREWLSQAPALVVYGDGAYGTTAIGTALSCAVNSIDIPIDRQWLSLWRRRFDEPLQDAESLVLSGKRLIEIGQRTDRLENVQGQFMGLLHITPVGWDQICKWLAQYEEKNGPLAIDRLDMTGMLAGMLDSGIALHCVDVNGGWVEIDSISDCSAVESALTDPDFRHDFRR